MLHPTDRFEVANIPNVFIPTNLDVSERVRANFPSFFNALFDATMQRMNNRAVVTEYAWTTQGCDPCTGPVLDANELSTLGADVLNDSGYHTGMTVTRLHTRYSRETLSDDLVFRQAAAATGGREVTVDANGGLLERGGRVDAQGTNNFQARYAIRHPWTGAITCANPQRGRWGGPPDGQQPAASRRKTSRRSGARPFRSPTTCTRRSRAQHSRRCATRHPRRSAHTRVRLRGAWQRIAAGMAAVDRRSVRGGARELARAARKRRPIERQ